MSVPETDWECPNRFIRISEVWILLKTYSQKLGVYLLKLVNHVYALDCNVSWIYKYKD